MGRNLAGTLVLMLGLLAVLIAPRVFGPGIAGAAERAPLPLPPPVGSCLVVERAISVGGGYVVPIQLPDYELVDCGEAHDLEVASSRVSEGPFRWDGIGDFPCSAESTRLYDSVAEHVPSPWFGAIANANVMLAIAPQSQRLGSAGWLACIIVPYPAARLRGSIWALSDIRTRPADFGNCTAAGITVSCTKPHSTEYLAHAWAQQPDDPALRTSDNPAMPPEAVMRQSCEALASDLLMRKDPTFGGLVRVSLTYEIVPAQEIWVDLNQNGGTEDSELFSGTGTNATCFIQTAENTLLTDSLVAIGDKPLPVQ